METRERGWRKKIMLQNTVRNTKQAKSKLSKSPTLALYEKQHFRENAQRKYHIF